MSLAIAHDHASNPLEVVEHLAAGNNWPFERAGEDEIAIIVTGRWTNYQISFTWMSEIEALHLACAFDMRIGELRLPEVLQLVSLINEQLWIGHFDIWQQERCGDVPSRAFACRGQRVRSSMRGGSWRRARRLRAVFPGVPVRGLGGKIGAGSYGQRDVRDLRRSLTDPGSSLAVPQIR